MLEYVSRLMALGRFRRLEPDAVAEIIIQFLAQSVLRWWQYGKLECEAPPDQFIAVFIDVILNGLLESDADKTATASS